MGFKTATEALVQAADSMRDQGMDARKIGFFIGVLAALPDEKLLGNMVLMIGGAKDKMTSIALENVAPEECETMLRAYECEQELRGMDGAFMARYAKGKMSVCVIADVEWDDDDGCGVG